MFFISNGTKFETSKDCVEFLRDISIPEDDVNFLNHLAKDDLQIWKKIFYNAQLCKLNCFKNQILDYIYLIESWFRE